MDQVLLLHLTEVHPGVVLRTSSSKPSEDVLSPQSTNQYMLYVYYILMYECVYTALKLRTAVTKCSQDAHLASTFSSWHFDGN